MRKTKTRITRLLALAVALAIALSPLPSIPSYAAKNSENEATDTTTPKIINVVYDDSTSMGGDLWCKAKYALEVFAAMMGEKDTMNVFFMHDYDQKHNADNNLVSKGTPSFVIKGKDKDRISTIENQTFDYMFTPIETVEAAANHLESQRASNKNAETWLVVLTDGTEFYRYFADDGNLHALGDNRVPNNTEDTKKTLEEILNGCAEKNKVAFLGIGRSAVEPSVLPERKGSFTVYKAVEGDKEKKGILDNVTKIANSIFEYQQLDESHIRTSSGSQELDIDIPTSKIIAFGQGLGENGTLGTLALAGTDLSGEKQKVDCANIPEKDIPTGMDGGAKTNPDLKGSVDTYTSEKTFSKGTFKISVPDGATVVYYYKPAVTAKLVLTNVATGQVVMPGEDIEEGKYKYIVQFLDDDGNDYSSSELLQIEDNSLSVSVQDESGNDIFDSTQKEGEFELSQGSITFVTRLTLKGNVGLGGKDKHKVVPKTARFKIEIQDGKTYKAQGLGDSSEPVIIKVIDERTGQPITDQQRAAIEFDENLDALKDNEISGAVNNKYIEFKVVLGTSPGTFEIRPYLKNGKKSTDVVEGTTYFSVELSGKIDGKNIEFNPSDPQLGKINIASYAGTTLVFESEQVTEPIPVDDLEDFEGILVRAYYIDDDTGQQVPISNEIWEEMELKFTRNSTKRIGWSWEKGSEPGTFRVHPNWWFKGVKISMPFTRGAAGVSQVLLDKAAKDGETPQKAKTTDLHVAFTASSNVGDLYYITPDNTEFTADMQDTPAKNFLRDLIISLVILALIIAVIIGYITKPRFDRFAMDPRIVVEEDMPPIRTDFRVDPFSVIWPFGPEKGIIFCRHAAYNRVPDAEVRAEGHHVFTIINAEEFATGGIEIAGDVFGADEVQTLKYRVFFYDEFTVQKVAEMGESVGQFHLAKKR